MPPAKPIPYPGDEYIKSLIASQGYLKKAKDNNLIVGLNVNIDDLSVGNIINAENAIVVKSHNNILNAKNVSIKNSNGCRIDGADHTIIGCNYSCCDGDANWMECYGGSCNGTFNKNFVENGSVDGANNVLGKQGFPNQFRNSSIKGQNNKLEGNNSHIIGSFIAVMGDNIIAVGNGYGKPPITEPGFYIDGIKVN